MNMVLLYSGPVELVLGLPGENSKSLETNEDSFRELLKVDDCIERLYIGVAMPLKGTPWCYELQSSQKIRGEYKRKTGRDIVLDDDPDYKGLSRIAIENGTSVTPSDIKASMNTMIQTALDKGIPKHKVGGFMWDV